MIYKKIAIISSKNKQAIVKKKQLIKKYDLIDLEPFSVKKLDEIDLIIALGGDGLMLHLLHLIEEKNIPVYGINFGTVGFLMNSNCDEGDLFKAIDKAIPSVIRPLKMIATDHKDKKHQLLAINEVSLLRQKNQTAKIKISINNKTRIENLAADGVLVATSAGSTAYNLSVRGPIIPFDSNLIALTPISPFRPKHWHGALLPNNSKVKFTILDQKERPVSASADFNEIRNVKEVEVMEDKEHQFTILFDENHSLEERIIREQFL
ncbi:MAG: NAD+ kinase [Lentimonas sp.]|jgi:NAD+ kinase